MAVLPPSCSVTSLPTPAAIITATLAASRIGAIATSSSSWRRISATTFITSCAPPDPQLSQWSISSTGPCGRRRTEVFRARDGFRQRRCDECVLAASRRGDREHAIANFLGSGRAAALGIADDDGRNAGVGRIGVRERREERCGEHVAASFHRARIAHDIARGPVLRCVAHDRGEQRQPAPRHDRFDLAGERAHHDVAGQFADVVHVDVRVGFVAGDDRRVVDQLGREVSVIVERHGDGKVGRDRAQSLDDFALRIVAVLDHHCAVQVE